MFYTHIHIFDHFHVYIIFERTLNSKRKKVNLCFTTTVPEIHYIHNYIIVSELLESISIFSMHDHFLLLNCLDIYIYIYNPHKITPPPFFRCAAIHTPNKKY